MAQDIDRDVQDVVHLLQSTTAGMWLMDRTKDIRGPIVAGVVPDEAKAAGDDEASLDFVARETTVERFGSVARRAVALGHQQRHLWQLFHREALGDLGYVDRNAAQHLLTATELDARVFDFMVRYELRKRHAKADVWEGGDEFYFAINTMMGSAHHGPLDVMARYFKSLLTPEGMRNAVARELKEFQEQGVDAPPLVATGALMQLGKSHLPGNYLERAGEKWIKILFSKPFVVASPVGPQAESGLS